MKKEKGDRLYTIMTVLAVLAFWGHNYFLVIDYFLVFLISLASIVCIALLWLIAFYVAKENQYRYMYKISRLVIRILLGCDILIWLCSPI